MLHKGSIAIGHRLRTTILLYERRLHVQFLQILVRVLGEFMHSRCQDWFQLQRSITKSRKNSITLKLRNYNSRYSEWHDFDC